MGNEIDADRLLREMRKDADSDWPTRLLHDLEALPLVDERDLNQPQQAIRSYDLSLTAGEVRLLDYVSRGLDNVQAAEATGVSLEAVKSQLKVVRYKLRAKNTTHACCEALRRGLIR